MAHGEPGGDGALPHASWAGIASGAGDGGVRVVRMKNPPGRSRAGLVVQAQESLGGEEAVAPHRACQLLSSPAAAIPVQTAPWAQGLLDAAILLNKYEVELPVALIRIVNQVDDASRDAEEGASGLAWLLRP